MEPPRFLREAGALQLPLGPESSQSEAERTEALGELRVYGDRRIRLLNPFRLVVPSTRLSVWDLTVIVELDIPTPSARSTARPPGCRLANLEIS